MAKSSKISFKTYFNEHLKQVAFHGTTTYPLYCQVTHARKPLFFKSSMFEQFSQERFSSRFNKKKAKPDLELVVKKETALLEFAVEKCRNSFTPEQFKESYKYYGTDLCASTEEAFRAYLVVFLSEKGMSSVGKVLGEGSINYTLFDIINEAKNLFIPTIYSELTSGLSKAPPYMELYSFTNEYKKDFDQVLTVMEWETPSTKEAFVKYLNKYSKQEIEQILKRIDQWLAKVMRSIKSDT